MRRTLAVRISTILLVVLALFASSAGLAVPSSSEARVQLAATIAPGASRVEGGHGLSSDSDGATRTAFIRPAPPSIARGHAPLSGRGGDAHDAVAPAAPQSSLNRMALRAPAVVELRRDGEASPGQPAPASRAPPVG